jgi:hypothetical protein
MFAANVKFPEAYDKPHEEYGSPAAFCAASIIVVVPEFHVVLGLNQNSTVQFAGMYAAFVPVSSMRPYVKSYCSADPVDAPVKSTP